MNDITNILFVYSKGGKIRCLRPVAIKLEDRGKTEHDALLADGWKHTATIDPAAWIEALMQAEPDHANDMMDELNFGK